MTKAIKTSSKEYLQIIADLKAKLKQSNEQVSRLKNQLANVKGRSPEQIRASGKVVNLANINIQNQNDAILKPSYRAFYQSSKGSSYKYYLNKLFPSDIYDDSFYAARSIVGDSIGINTYFNWWNSDYFDMMIVKEIIDLVGQSVWDVIDKFMFESNSKNEFNNWYAFNDNWQIYNLKGRLLNVVAREIAKIERRKSRQQQKSGK